MATRWEKRGVIFNVDGAHPWMAHHACVPTPLVRGDRLRIYFAPRDSANRSRITFIECRADDPNSVLYVHDRPVLDLGTLGAFDDSGVMPASIVEVGDELWLYYIGWSPAVTVPYRNSIGLAISLDDGLTFRRAFQGPLVDRTRAEPFFTASPFVLREDAGWRLWYASTIEFTVVDGKPEPVYVIKYAESDNGIDWRRENVTCIQQKRREEANARPYVLSRADRYEMWFCYRGSRGYRNDPSESYRIGYASSYDGIVWERNDDRAGIELSRDGWDSQMLAYPAVYEHGGQLHLLYNGNGFGLTGIGHAVAVG